MNCFWNESDIWHSVFFLNGLQNETMTNVGNKWHRHLSELNDSVSSPNEKLWRRSMFFRCFCCRFESRWINRHANDNFHSSNRFSLTFSSVSSTVSWNVCVIYYSPVFQINADNWPLQIALVVTNICSVWTVSPAQAIAVMWRRFVVVSFFQASRVAYVNLLWKKCQKIQLFNVRM